MQYGPAGPTFEQICQAWVRHTRPEITDPNEIARLAREFWESDPSGSVEHVVAAGNLLGLLQAPAR